MEMAPQLVLRPAPIGERRLRHDGLQKRGGELQQQAPCAGPGRAACAKRGESSNSPIGGSSNKMTGRLVPVKTGMGQHIRRGGALVYALRERLPLVPAKAGIGEPNRGGRRSSSTACGSAP